MKFFDLVFYSFNSLKQRKLRSWLTVLGIVVGITSIVVLVGLVQGLRDYFDSQLSSFGARSIVVLPVNVETSANPAASAWLPSNGKLFMKDYERLKRIPDIETITPVLIGRVSVDYKNQSISSSVLGVDPEIYKQTVGTVEIDKGRFLESSDQKSIIVGSSIANDTFDEDILLSSTLKISGADFRVVGILEKSGASFTNIDSSILMPIDEARIIFGDILADKEVHSIRITVVEDANISEVAERVEYEMFAAHRVTEDNKDFGVITSDFINNQLDEVTGILSIFLGGVASISLIVGGVGIANTMFMSVAERKREIGILKSIGARESEILHLFLVESSMIGIAGGFFGVVLAYLISGVITLVSGINVSILPLVVFGAVFFSGVVGIISGAYPAKSAAKLDPVEALGG
ncbi:MAG: ABC transporter permease [Candidatus Micrarchaeota archaeon]